MFAMSIELSSQGFFRVFEVHWVVDDTRRVWQKYLHLPDGSIMFLNFQKNKKNYLNEDVAVLILDGNVEINDHVKLVDGLASK